MTDKTNIILEKILVFAVRIYNLSRILKDKNNEYSLSDQLLRSGTSIGAII
jgi:four helix bundle protein